MPELLAFEILHGEVVESVRRGAELDHLHDVRMVHLAGGLVLALEALHRDSIASHVRMQHLDRYARLGVEVPPLIDAPHGTVGHARNYEVVTETFP